MEGETLGVDNWLGLKGLRNDTIKIILFPGKNEFQLVKLLKSEAAPILVYTCQAREFPLEQKFLMLHL